MLIPVTCKKCGNSTKIDVGNLNKEEVNRWLTDNGDGFECFGNHVEFGVRADYWELDWEHPEEGNAPTEEEFVNTLKERYEEVLTNEEMTKKYDIRGFAYGMCSAVNRETGESYGFDFKSSPNSHNRYYFR